MPVCTPALAAKLRCLADFSSATLLMVSHLQHHWTCWFNAAGMNAPVPHSGEVMFEANAMAMQAAFDGVGVAIAQLPFASDALLAGRLVAPFPIAAQMNEAWYLEYRPIRQEEPALQAFRAWLQGEAERQRQIEADLLKKPGGKQTGMV
jgi:LysR family glycine cleavage system transcriptional activator/LysR family transcriptional regulator of beta-lactamase